MPKANVNGINIHYKVHGQGEPLALIQGFGGGHQGWFFQTRAFKNYYRVVTFDNRGVGKTDKPREPYTIKTMADDVIALMDYLGIDKAHILGASMGGMIAQEVVLNYPERVGKLVLVVTHAGIDEESEVSLEMLKALGFEEGYSEEGTANSDLGRLMRAVISLSFNKRLSKLILVPLAHVYTRIVGVKGLTGQFEAIKDYYTQDRLHMIKAPTLVMTGTEDKLMPPGSSEVLASMIPDAKLVRVEGGSHAFHLEMSGRFNKEVLDFLRGD